MAKKKKNPNIQKSITLEPDVFSYIQKAVNIDKNSTKNFSGFLNDMLRKQIYHENEKQRKQINKEDFDILNKKCDIILDLLSALLDNEKIGFIIGKELSPAYLSALKNIE
ncbi:hypothetical protein GMA11_03350 [Granulicatella sp. zg-ZJ]|uniref:hypothetical protein n=1 Tax=Granulicatella sp. zg-ZJ TaxID=2678504 RepID=UPI0013D23DF2|nr:hypothetical protein [Granulicatella sp. zg-ZJ]MBS4749605.1 hypothetical protein [Carnobacteriaceae bacterium zg-ZUI78]NEW62422.1 hypothetical protein [Granulicatella sp. zg-ZJ]